MRGRGRQRRQFQQIRVVIPVVPAAGGPSNRVSLARRRALLTATLGFALLDTRSKPAPPEVQTVCRWLDNWTGIGHVAVGMARQDYDLQLARYADRGWRATFYVSGVEHSVTNARGTAWEATPWRAVQIAAWEALEKTQGDQDRPKLAENISLP